MHSLAAATSSEGLTARTSLYFPDLCHSSVVKVQPTPKHAKVLGADREVWGLGGRSVKRAGGPGRRARGGPGRRPDGGPIRPSEDARLDDHEDEGAGDPRLE